MKYVLAIVVGLLAFSITHAQPRPPSQPPYPAPAGREWVQIAEGQWALKPEYPGPGGVQAVAPSFLAAVERLEAANKARAEAVDPFAAPVKKVPLCEACECGGDCDLCTCGDRCCCGDGGSCWDTILRWRGPDARGYYFLWLGGKPKGVYHPTWETPKTWGANGEVPLKVKPPVVKQVAAPIAAPCRS